MIEQALRDPLVLLALAACVATGVPLLISILFDHCFGPPRR